MSKNKELKDDIYIFDDIDNEISREVIENINLVNEYHTEAETVYADYERRPIHLHIQSFGGSVYDGLGIIDAITKSTTPVYTITRGYAMSMAFIIACVGHQRFCYDHTTFMFHQLSAGNRGTLTDLIEKNKEYERLQEVAHKIITDYTKIPLNKLEEVNKHKTDWYFTPKEAMELGVVNKIVGGSE